MKVVLKKSDHNTILSHCTAGLPNEACGLLAGTKENDTVTVTKVYLLTNVDASREHFSMDPKEQLSALKDARANGYGIVGNFHSHPESPSRPSERRQKTGIRSIHRVYDSFPYGRRQSRYSNLIRTLTKKKT